MSDRVDDTDMTDTATDGPSDATSDASTADQNDAEPDVPPHRAAPRSGRLDSEERQGVPYTESQVIMPTVKVVVRTVHLRALYHLPRARPRAAGSRAARSWPPWCL